MRRIAGPQMAWAGCAAIQNPLRTLTAELVSDVVYVSVSAVLHCTLRARTPGCIGTHFARVLA